MNHPRPFVVTVASEKGGVGKTTLATNLAVYLKALREDLPVTIVSFDNHFSVENMFAIGSKPGRSVAGLFRGEAVADLVQLGEYGVQYFASERLLVPPDSDPSRLKSVLAASGLGGILIIDTRPIIDYFTHSALTAADLLLVPVKDRPSLVNAAAVLDTFGATNDRSAAWLVPSIIDARLRLRGDIGVREFLSFSARERGYQVLDTYLANSPKVESLATSLSSRIYPILTHARNTVVHQQMREIADFVLQAREAWCASGASEAPSTAIPPGRLRRLVRECPVCGEVLGNGALHYLHDHRSRSCGAIHGACLAGLLDQLDAGDFLDLQGALLMFDLGDAGLTGPADDVALRLFSGAGQEILHRAYPLCVEGCLEPFLRAACGRAAEEFFRDRLFVGLMAAPLSRHLDNATFQTFQALRRQALRQSVDGLDELLE